MQLPKRADRGPCPEAYLKPISTRVSLTLAPDVYLCGDSIIPWINREESIPIVDRNRDLPGNAGDRVAIPFDYRDDRE